MSEYTYQPGDIVEILPGAYYTWGSSGRRGGQRGLERRVGEHIRITGLDGDGDIEGEGIKNGRELVVSPECVKPIEIQGVREGDAVRVFEAYGWDDAALSRVGPVVVKRLDVDMHFHDQPHPFVLHAVLVAASRVEKVEESQFPERELTTLRLYGGSTTEVGSRLDGEPVRVAPRRYAWSDVGPGDVVTAEWKGLKNEVESEAVVTSRAVKDDLLGGLAWYGQSVRQLSDAPGLWRILEIVPASRAARERRYPQEVRIVRPQTTGGRWDDYNLVTVGRAYVEGVPDGSGMGKYNLTAVFEDGKGDVQLKDRDWVYVNGFRMSHDLLFDATHHEK